ncbi:hypothetical protein [Trichlorobacter ammonificans]|uniref:Lipoprotein n=1 Tax=Trichlorobacter ammonificans TaxID=2916410 RepID=A0ABM9D6K3_9BACT|nr:hypothetical protein [Trichlorobacter ammonificans]CAH2030051.1 conserved exported protein of unknown function [Trichlorobacter ammonificans]
MKKLAILLLLLLCSGCVSGIRNDIQSYERRISSRNGDINRAEKYLNNNPDVYVENTCVTPARGPKPKPLCESKEKATEYALARCAISYKGCDATLSLLGGKLDTFSKKFLASEICDRLVEHYQGNSYNSYTTARNAMEAVADRGIERGGFWGVVGGVTKLAIEAQKYDDFQRCRNNESSRCYNAYVDWWNGPFNKKEQCENSVKTIAASKDDIETYEYRIYKLKSKWMWRLFGD